MLYRLLSSLGSRWCSRLVALQSLEFGALLIDLLLERLQFFFQGLHVRGTCPSR